VRIDIPGTYNFREVLPARPGTLYRSDALHRVTRAGRAALRRLGISRVIDLRGRWDVRIGGRDRIRGVGAELIRIPIDAGTPSSEASTLELSDVYRTLLADYGDSLGEAIRAIADADGPVVVHCTAGKDRSGLVVALTLLAIGTPVDQVVADYALTETNLAGEWADRMMRKVRRFRIPITDTLVEIITRSPAPALLDALSWIEETHGGVRPYLSSIGVTDAHLARLTERYAPDPLAAPRA